MPKNCPQCGASLPTGTLGGLCPACLLAQGAAETGNEAPPFQPPGVEEVARLFPQLEILAFIGKGGMGAVYKARQPALDRFVALKILPPQVANGPGFAERFNREARALARLSHPHIVAVHEFGQVNDLPFFLMEFVDGPNLRQLERAGKLSPREALQIVPQICEALQFAHDEGIVHRDIKPENILLDKKGRVKIADFGIAKIMGREPDRDLAETQGAIGTPHYMAPEQMEKPKSVDHRADIFSLGVVFYEMLTGELPLGKFAPPSSRMQGVGVDVRLDEVVLRALEKEPERRYQHVSQVKTAVDTIASTAAVPPSIADAEATAREILARDYVLNIRSCLRRGWTLVKSDFWPTVGITALVLFLLSLAGSIGDTVDHSRGGARLTSGLAILVSGPLMGGLYLYFLKKIRGEKTTVETAFAGFSKYFLHLFLAGLVTTLLTGLGFLCLIIPGVYLLVAWVFALPLVIDRQLHFWAAMELSRKLISKHWFKFLGFGIVLLLLGFVGVLACGVGIFITAPVILAALMYAYEDILGTTGRTTSQPSPAVGPSGTIVLPGAPASPPQADRGISKPVMVGLGAVILGLLFLAVISHRHTLRNSENRARHDQAGAAEPAASVSSDQPAAVAAKASTDIFGPVKEQVVTNEVAIDFDSGRWVGPLPASVRRDGTSESILAAFVWMEQEGLDALYLTSEGLLGPGMKKCELDEANWTNLPPPALESRMASLVPDPLRPVRMRTAANGPATYGFSTRKGGVGIVQLSNLVDQPGAVNIRYKLVAQSPVSENASDTAVPVAAPKISKDTLTERLEAASLISNAVERDKATAAAIIDAARAGEAQLVLETVGHIVNSAKHDDTAHEAAGLLAKRGLRKSAIEVAQTIANSAARDQALSELAR